MAASPLRGRQKVGMEGTHGRRCPCPVPSVPLPSSSRMASDRELSSEVLSSAGTGTAESGAGATTGCQNSPTAPAATQRVPAGLRSRSPPPVPTRSAAVAAPAGPALPSPAPALLRAAPSLPGRAGGGCWAGLGALGGMEPPPPCHWCTRGDGCWSTGGRPGTSRGTCGGERGPARTVPPWRGHGSRAKSWHPLGCNPWGGRTGGSHGLQSRG